MQEQPLPTTGVELFFSYAREDASFRDELEKHFSFLKRQKKLVSWHDGMIKGGQEWRQELERHLNSADVILLLVSADFVNSDFCYDTEMERAMERHEAGEAVVVPILLRPCVWDAAPFAKLRMLPGEKAITIWTDRDDALYKVAIGVREVVEELLGARRAAAPPGAGGEARAAQPASNIPAATAVAFVTRCDVQGRDFVDRLARILKPGATQLAVLKGEPGVGKTTIAAQTARAVEDEYGARVVWVAAGKSSNFTFQTLLNQIAVILGEPAVTRMAHEWKEEAVRRLLAAAPTLIVLDHFDNISPGERKPCADFLAERVGCPALVTSRKGVAHDAARHIKVGSMSDEEARQFIARWVGEQAYDRHAFAELRYDEIIGASEALPHVLLWLLAQLDLAPDPREVLAEIATAEGELGVRVFQRSFELPQLGDDGRAALLALSLFAPDASRLALAHVAGFGDDLNRLNEAAGRLAVLRLVETTPDDERLSVEGLAHDYARSRFDEDLRADDFRRRYVAYFLRHAEAHRGKLPADFAELEAEKENLLAAMEAAYRMSDWQSVMSIRAAIDNFLFVRGHWDEAVRSGERAKAAAREAGSEEDVAFFTACVAMINRHRREYDEAQAAYEVALAICRRAGREEDAADCLNQLAVIARERGRLEEAERLHCESIGMAEVADDPSGVARALQELGRTAQAQGRTEKARRLYLKSLNLKKSLSNPSGVARLLKDLGLLDLQERKFDEASQRFHESLEIQESLGNQLGIGITISCMGRLAGAAGDRAEATRLLRESLEILRRLGSHHAERVRAELAAAEGETA